MKFTVLDISNKVVSETEYPVAFTGDDYNFNHILYLISKYQKSSLRQGTSSSKTRSEVSGGGAKPYKQKGTGHARRGSNRSPLRRGGGRAFGPKPRDFAISLNHELISTGIQNLLISKFSDMVILNSGASLIKTSEMISFINLTAPDVKKIVFVVDDSDLEIMLALRNIPNVSIMSPRLIFVDKVVAAEKLYISSKAFSVLMEKES